MLVVDVLVRRIVLLVQRKQFCIVLLLLLIVVVVVVLSVQYISGNFSLLLFIYCHDCRRAGRACTCVSVRAWLLIIVRQSLVFDWVSKLVR